MAYASQYYDPKKAHEYYEEHKKLKGRKSKAGLNDEGKKAATYVQQQLIEERKKATDELKNQVKTRISELQNKYKHMSKRQKKKYKAEIQDAIKSLRQTYQEGKEQLKAHYDGLYEQELDKVKDDAGMRIGGKSLSGLNDEARAKATEIRDGLRAERKKAVDTVKQETKNQIAGIRERFKKQAEEIRSRRKEEKARLVSDHKEAMNRKIRMLREHLKSMPKDQREMMREQINAQISDLRDENRRAVADIRAKVDEQYPIDKGPMGEEISKLRETTKQKTDAIKADFEKKYVDELDKLRSDKANRRYLELRYNPNHDAKTGRFATGSGIKDAQLKIIQKYNPMQDDYHTGIRTVNDIKTAEEAFKTKVDEDEDYLYPDFTMSDGMKALEKGKITVYSSKPISQGGFVSPSKMMAQDYTGGGKVYSKEVDINDVAWIDSNEGQYANINEERRKE